MHKITVIGAGFGALTAVENLRKLDSTAEITLIAPNDELLYAPSLIWIPSRLRSADDLRIPLKGHLDKLNIHYHKGSVTGLSDNGRTVHTDNGDVSNDGLIIASGGRFIKKLPGIEHALTICEGLPAAEAMRDKLEAMDGGTLAFGFGGNPKEPTAVRGGPMFELLFGTETLLRKQGRRDKFKFVFFSPAPKPGVRLGEKAVGKLLQHMKKRNIETHLGHKMVGFEANKVKTEGGEFEADLIMFMPGLTGPAWIADAGLTLSEGGFIKADRHARAVGTERIYVAGDSGSFEGPDWMPKQAHMADLQAETAAKNLLAELDGKKADARFKVELVCIIDTNEKGILVYRSENRSLVTPPCRLLHYAKRFFEGWYLRKFR